MESTTLDYSPPDIPDDLKARYLERRRKDVISCSEAVQQRDFKTLERVGHQIKGNALSFGYPELETIGAEIEISAKSQDVPGLETQIQLFAKWADAQK